MGGGAGGLSRVNPPGGAFGNVRAVAHRIIEEVEAVEGPGKAEYAAGRRDASAA